MDNITAHYFTFLAVMLSILFVYGATDEKDELCKKNHMAACAPPNKFPLNIPENEEELGELCRFWPSYMACVRNYILTCTGSFDDEDHYQKVYTTTLAVCGEDTVLHEGLIRNLACLKKVAKQPNPNCINDKAKIFEAFEVVAEKQEEDWAAINCLVQAFNIDCFLRKTASECGAQAENISKEVVVRSEYNLEACPGDIKQKAEQLLEKLNLDQSFKLVIRNVINIS